MISLIIINKVNDLRVFRDSMVKYKFIFNQRCLPRRRSSFLNSPMSISITAVFFIFLVIWFFRRRSVWWSLTSVAVMLFGAWNRTSGEILPRLRLFYDFLKFGDFCESVLWFNLEEYFEPDRWALWIIAVLVLEDFHYAFVRFWWGTSTSWKGK